jgi:hypothetical protein
MDIEKPMRNRNSMAWPDVCIIASLTLLLAFLICEFRLTLPNVLVCTVFCIVFLFYRQLCFDRGFEDGREYERKNSQLKENVF